MPGLVGFSAGAAPRPTREARLREFAAAISHQPFHQSDAPFVDDRLCATRVHIGLVQPQAQPWSERGWHVWFDGELFNQHELRQRIDGVAESDSAILLALLRDGLERRDLSLLAKIDGIFAAVVYDANAGRLHLLSDRYGLRHLYYAADASGVFWSSEQKVFALREDRPATIGAEAAREFLEVGYATGDRSWFDDVVLLAPGSVHSFELESGRASTQQYWSFESIRPAHGPFDERELRGEIARRLRSAVRRRARPGERVGLRLSGGLDSRAILAAMPEHAAPLHALSFGKAGCDDVRIAALAARVRGAQHHVFELRSQDWLDARIDAVWWTDAQLNLMHMHGAAVMSAERDLYDFNLSGFLGDVIAGGSYLAYAGVSESESIANRGRRFVVQGPRLSQVFLEQRLPFMANDLLELLLSLPTALRADARLYQRVLLEAFPEYFERIPWQTTGVPIAWSGGRRFAARALRGVVRRSRRALRRVGVPWSDPSHYADYAQWLREGAARSVFEERLLARDAELLAWVDAREIAAAWRAHLAGEDHSERLGRMLTLELFARRLRGAGA